jgi:hypothetical protein
MDRLNQPLVNHIRSNSVNHRDARLRPAPAVTKGPAGHTPRFRSLTVVRFGRFGGDADGGNGAHFGAARNRDASSLCGEGCRRRIGWVARIIFSNLRPGASAAPASDARFLRRSFAAFAPRKSNGTAAL